jgi:hypothetical protein
MSGRYVCGPRDEKAQRSKSSVSTVIATLHFLSVYALATAGSKTTPLIFLFAVTRDIPALLMPWTEPVIDFD